MHSVGDVIDLLVIFIGIYVQLFLFFTYLGWGAKKKPEIKNVWSDSQLPTVGIIIPCWNEEKTVSRTLDSLLAADYPREKLEVIIVDDGSKDNTWEAVQKYASNPQIRMYQKENGGKYTALNFGIEKATASIIGCLDADSTIAPDSIKSSVYKFLDDAEVMSVVPAMTIENPQSLIQLIQKVEFESVIYLRQAFSFLGALFIASGPLSLFRKEVFERTGGYRHAYLGEDLELSMRMQFNHMKIIYNPESHVYTHGPKTWKALLKQRVRWTYSFFKNAADYKGMFFNREYGHLGMFILPVGWIGNVVTVLLVPFLVYNLGVALVHVIQPLVWGVYPVLTMPSFGSLFVGIGAISILGVIAIIFGFLGVMIGRSTINQKFWSLDLITYLLYPFLSMVWTVKATWKTIAGSVVTWR